jgi:hypothetical protein
MTQMRNSLLILLMFTLLSCASNVKSLKDTPGTATSRDALETARQYVKNNDFRRAVKYYDLILTSYTNDTKECSWALYEKSYCFLKLNRKDAALAGFRNLRSKYGDEGPGILAAKMLEKLQPDK